MSAEVVTIAPAWELQADKLTAELAEMFPPRILIKNYRGIAQVEVHGERWCILFNIRPNAMNTVSVPAGMDITFQSTPVEYQNIILLAYPEARAEEREY